MYTSHGLICPSILVWPCPKAVHSIHFKFLPVKNFLKITDLTSSWFFFFPHLIFGYIVWELTPLSIIKAQILGGCTADTDFFFRSGNSWYLRLNETQFYHCCAQGTTTKTQHDEDLFCLLVKIKLANIPTRLFFYQVIGVVKPRWLRSLGSCLC